MENQYDTEIQDRIKYLVNDHLKDLENLSDLLQIELDWIVSQYINEFTKVKEKI